MAVPKKSPEGTQPNKADIEENKFIAALSYLGILVFIPLVMKKDSAFTQFHAKQGLALFIIEMIGMILVWTLLLSWLGFLVLVASAVVSLYGIVMTVSGEKTVIPGLSHIAEKFNF